MALLEACYDEIALEGLDGITLNGLWYRLSRRRPVVSIRVDENSKSYYWNIIVSLQEVEFFCLPYERPDLHDVENFFDPEARLLLYKEHPFIKMYPFNPVDCDGLRGSCATISTRSNVSSEVRGSEYTPQMSLSEVVQRWGNRFVVVASQRRREMALLGPCTDVASTLPLLEGMNYLYLEAIGRTRHDGLLGTDAFVHLQVPGKKKAQGRMFYHKKVLVSLGLILKQDYMVMKGGRYCNDNVCHLIRYYKPLKTFYIDLHDKLEEYLASCPNQRDSKRGAFQAVDPDGKWTRFKRFLKERSEYFAKDYAPSWEFYPDAQKSALSGEKKEKAVPCIRLVKRRDEQAEDEDCQMSDEEEESPAESDLKKARPFCGEPMMAQLARYVHSLGPAGVSQQMIRQHFDLHTLMARNIVKSVLQRKVFLSFFIDKGRQREQRLRSHLFKDITISSANCQSANATLPAVSTPVPSKPPSGKRVSTPAVPLMPPQSSSADNSHVQNSEQLSTPDCGSSSVLSGSSKGKNTSSSTKKEVTTSRMQERMDFIVNRVQEARVLTFCTIAKELRTNEATRYKDQIDRRSLRRLIERLAREERVKSYVTMVEIEGKSKELHYICEGNVSFSDRLLQSILEQERCQLLTNKIATEHRYETKKKKEIVEADESEPVDFMQRHPVVMNIGKSYGYQARLRRVEILHKFLWYLTYGVDGKANPLPSAGGNSSEPPVYVDDETWKRYVPPLPDYPGFDRGWCLLADAISCMPVSMFLQIVRIPYQVDGLLGVLADSTQNLTMMRDLRQDMRGALMYKRHYATCCYQLVQLMALLGLATFGKTTAPFKDMVFIYIHRNASLRNTMSAQRGYATCINAESLPIQHYEMKDEESVNQYWKDLQLISLNTPLGYKQLTKAERPLIEHSKSVLTKQSLQYAFKPRQPADIVDDGRLHGDGLGAAGLDSGLFSHRLRNWVAERLAVKYEKAVPVLRLPAGHDQTLPNDLSTLVSGPLRPKSGRLAGLRTVEDKLQQLCTVTVYNKSRGDVAVTAMQETVPVYETTAKALRGGGAGLKRKARATDESAAKKRKLSKITEPSKTSRKRKLLSLTGLSTEEMAVEKNRFDEIDMQALRNMKTLRASWTPPEDVMLLLCKVGLMVMNVPTHAYPWREIRNWLHKSVEACRDKSYKACHRRMVFMLKNLDAVRNVNLHLAEALRDEELAKYRQKKFERGKGDLSETFVKVMTLLLSKFRRHLGVQKQVIQLPCSLEELHSLYHVENPHISERRLPDDVVKQEDAQAFTLTETIIGFLLVNDKVGRGFEMQHVFSHYSKQFPENVIATMHSNGILSKQRIHARKKVQVTQMRYYDLSSMFHNTFRLSSRFTKELYLCAWRYFSAVAQIQASDDSSPPTGVNLSATSAASVPTAGVRSSAPDQMLHAKCIATTILLAVEKAEIECRFPKNLSVQESGCTTDGRAAAASVPELPPVSFRPGTATQYLVMRRVNQAAGIADEQAVAPQTGPVAAGSILGTRRSEDNSHEYGDAGTDQPPKKVSRTSDSGGLDNMTPLAGGGEPAHTPSIGDDACQFAAGDAKCPGDVPAELDSVLCTGSIGVAAARAPQARDASGEPRVNVAVTVKQGSTLEHDGDDVDTSFVKAGLSKGHKEILKDLAKRVPEHVDDWTTCRMRIACADPTISPAILTKMDAVYEYIDSAGELGVEACTLYDSSSEHSHIEDMLSRMIEQHAILRVGSLAFRYVSLQNARLWIAKSLKNTRGRGNVGYEGTQATESGDTTGDSVKSTYKSVWFVPRVWKKPDGSLIASSLGTMLSSVLTYILMAQGCSTRQLFEKFRGALSPVPLLELLETLERLKCIQRRCVQPAFKTSLFSKLPPIIQTSANAAAPSSNTFLFATVDCVLRLGEFLDLIVAQAT